MMEIARKEVVPQALISNFGLITGARLLKFHFSNHPADDSPLSDWGKIFDSRNKGRDNVDGSSRSTWSVWLQRHHNGTRWAEAFQGVLTVNIIPRTANLIEPESSVMGLESFDWQPVCSTLLKQAMFSVIHYHESSMQRYWSR